MGACIGIRREDKNNWERRVPLIPEDLAVLRALHGLEFVVQPSAIRIFDDEEFSAAGVAVAEDISACEIIFAVKEIPLDLLLKRKVYVFFSHTIKGQSYNMPLLRKLMEGGSTLIDYERIADEQNRRLIFFSVHAGYAGMIESLVFFGRRLALDGVQTPLLDLKQTYEYPTLEAAKDHLRAIGRRIAQDGMGGRTLPAIIGIAGYGNVSRGCQEILECLPVTAIEVEDLPRAAADRKGEFGPLVKVVFHEEDMVEPRSSDAQFVLQDYYQHPDNYRSVFDRHLQHLDLLMNTIYWEEKYPRLLTRKWAKSNCGPGKDCRLRLVGDISCDIAGSIELTLKATKPDQACFTVDPESLEITDGLAPAGLAIMAVDNLPCELPREASAHFSHILKDMVPEMAGADFNAGFESLHLPTYLKKAVIVHRGELTPGYRYLQEFLDKSAK